MLVVILMFMTLVMDNHNSDDCGTYLDCEANEFCDRDGFCVDLNEGYVEPAC
jgi:hypothetical protein